MARRRRGSTARRKKQDMTEDLWAGMKDLDSAMATDDEGQECCYRVGDLVAVQPAKDAGSMLWHAKIKCMRVGKKATEVWVKLLWFFTGEDAELLEVYKNDVADWDLGNLSPNELLFSDDEGIIHIDAIERPSWIVHFDDTLADVPFISREEGLFYRWELSVSGGQLKGMVAGCVPQCPFKGIYGTDRVGQRYCSQCKHWFHLGCMNRERNIPQPPALAVSGVETGNAELDRVLAIPISRGVFDGISGNGRELLRLRKWGMERLDDQVDHGMDEEYLNSLPTTWPYFRCTLCGGTI